MRKKSLLTVLASLAGLALMAQAALAHDLWLSVDNPRAQQPLKIAVGYGHSFPASEPTEPEKVVQPYVLGAQGRIETQKGQDLTFLTQQPLEAGTYLVLGGRLPQWYTKTPEGTKEAPKDQAPGAVSCLQSSKFAKAIVNLGPAKGKVDQVAGQTLEIVPQANPAGLKAGDKLPILVLFEGKPLAQAKVAATYAGFKAEKQGAMAFEGQTDANGKLLVPLAQAGPWLLVAKHEMPFADQAHCDKQMFGASLTFELK